MPISIARSTARKALFHTLFASLAAAAVLMSAGPGHAEISPWAIDEGGRMRVVAMPPEPDGTLRGALQIEPKPDWVTYWREPGDAGIAPQLTFAPESQVTLTRVSYPVPKRIDSGNLRDIGYDHPVTLPFELKVEKPGSATGNDAGQPLNLQVSAFIGLCRDICIPFKADFSLSLAAVRGTPVEEAMILNAAMATLPQPPSDDFAVTHYAMRQGRDLLSLTFRLPAGTQAAPQVFVTGPQGHVVFDGLNGSREGDSYSLDMPIGKLPENYDIKGKHWGILVVAGKRAMETSLLFD